MSMVCAHTNNFRFNEMNLMENGGEWWRMVENGEEWWRMVENGGEW